jgi:hypothetical protein
MPPKSLYRERIGSIYTQVQQVCIENGQILIWICSALTISITLQIIEMERVNIQDHDPMNELTSRD